MKVCLPRLERVIIQERVGRCGLIRVEIRPHAVGIRAVRVFKLRVAGRCAVTGRVEARVDYDGSLELARRGLRFAELDDAVRDDAWADLLAVDVRRDEYSWVGGGDILRGDDDDGQLLQAAAGRGRGGQLDQRVGACGQSRDSAGQSVSRQSVSQQQGARGRAQSVTTRCACAALTAHSLAWDADHRSQRQRHVYCCWCGQLRPAAAPA
jgi:hypothetical protein